MTDSGKQILDDTQGRMDKALSHLRDELKGIRSGRATPALVENIRVDYYGSPTPLLQLAQISVPEPRQLAVKPFDIGAIKEIERAILKSDTGLSPSSDGKMIRLSLPPLSEEQRKKLAHRVKDIAEQARVSLRNIRRDGNKHIEQAKKSAEISEDQARDFETEIQEGLKKHEGDVDDILKAKTEEIMTV
ncbi:MAG: ribosome recycling factor [Planctomycetes bacterium]|jgi:ribosome recycling factor|nr:ribosome recycling factor [Planctomycetota bacterium]